MTPDPQFPPLSIESVLVVDDSRAQRQYAVQLCRVLGIPVIHEAGNGVEALELLTQLPKRPSLMLVDLEMPSMDGIELIQALKHRGEEIALVVVSSRESALIDSVQTMSHALGLQVLAALQKPLNLPQLSAALQRYGQPRSLRHPAPVQPRLGVAELHEGLRQGQITPYFQPKVDVRTGVIKGVEALARWMHPTLGVILPDHFVPTAEQGGLIQELTTTMAEQACAQAARWNAHGLRLSIAINLSPRLFDSEAFVGYAADLMARHALQSEQVVWEITESSVVANLGAALGTLARLRLKGFGLSIDDYGTGFSSMQQLARIPFTELKIDRTFVSGANERHQLRVILQSALEMANRLNLVTVAEGVELLDDWRLLQDFGCTLGQGFLVARPMTGDELPIWLRRHSQHLRALREGHLHRKPTGPAH
ncbi:EAL domain-containing response regulator [Chitiniphilus purpureus]|uniref:EAL domain-containing response regulator n=1 Tax=Chitiniphilus purpureus TaxID=2981137 RepID=A0ABY6DPN4_9NEIS|nr:EAL domain-containing response regulator [Chitiniphilus sp. CD1]UXY16334.1 EAL domain-containing response regulator [Chitiniphilus sp. CD1]